MKANEFVKKFGWEEAKIICNGVFTGVVCYKWVELNIDDLKRLVESHELVEKHGGLLNVKNSFQMERDCGGVDMTPFGKKLYQAILDVESCQ